MVVIGKQISAGFQGMGGNPDVVGGDGFSLST
jgi:hypothetical protein